MLVSLWFVKWYRFCPAPKDKIGRVLSHPVTKAEALAALLHKWAFFGEDMQEKAQFHFDITNMLPLVRFWLAQNNYAARTVHERVVSAGADSVLSEVMLWVGSWLAKCAAELRLGWVNHGSYFRNLILLGLALDLELSGSSWFRGDTARRIRSQSLETLELSKVWRQLEALGLAVLRRHCSSRPELRSFLESEQLLELLYKAVRVELAPDIKLALLSPKNDLLGNLAKKLEPFGMFHVDAYGDEFRKAQNESFELCRISKLRGSEMINKTIDNMTKHRLNTAILVFGGFHTESVINDLQRDLHKDIDWSVIRPKISKKR